MGILFSNFFFFIFTDFFGGEISRLNQHVCQIRLLFIQKSENYPQKNQISTEIWPLKTNILTLKNQFSYLKN